MPDVRSTIFDMENDVRSAVEFMSAALVIAAAGTRVSLDPDERNGLHRLVDKAYDHAVQVREAWEALIEMSRAD